MRTLALLATLTIVAIAFAGCSGEGDGGDDASSSSSSTSRSGSSTGTSTKSSTGSSTGSATGTSTGSAPNRAPAGSLSVAVNGTNATFTLTGSDPDGDTIVWDLTFGDGAATNGTGLPANATHSYASAGNFTANFTITDGQSPVTYNLTVPVAGAGSAGIVFVQKQTTPSNPLGSTVIPNVGFAGANACAGFTGGDNGVDCVWFDLLPEYAGHLFTATTDVGDPDYEFWPACPFPENAGAPPGLAITGSTATGPESGEIPDGAGCIVLWTKLSPEIPEHTFTVF